MPKNNVVYQAYVALATFVALLFMPSNSWAATYSVATTGSDTNAGTSVAPWKTIHKAANTMSAGDTVTVLAGTYNEQVTMNRSGAAGALITFKASGTAKVMKGFVINANYIVIDGFDITNNLSQTWTANGIYISGAYNIVQNNYIHNLRYQGIRVGDDNDNAAHHDNIIRNNTIYKASLSGIDIGGRNSLVENNDISHTIQHPPGGDVANDPDADGIHFFGSGHTIRQNTIHDITCSEAGNVDPHIDCFQTWGPAYNIVIERNLCNQSVASAQRGCQPQGVMVEELFSPTRNLMIKNNVFRSQVGILLINAERATVVNNTFRGYLGNTTWATGVQLNTSPNSKVQNNVFYDVGELSRYPAFDTDAPSLVGSTIGYNAYFVSSGTLVGSPYPGDIRQQDPKFVDVAGGNYHLQSTSPLIDKGITLSVVPTDFGNVARPQGRGFDIGAYEFTSSTIIPSAPGNLTLKIQ